ncbi:MAG TPA: cyclodeaminase/cyclohydrolase family protein [Chlorobaculum sp.]|nr:cyclodeaminase/cyclohydrolase family protein [Chlorobaculum sp.]
MVGATPISEYLDELAGAAPTPGGGAAAALTGAQGVALLSMVCRLTAGREKFSAVEGEIRSILAIMDETRPRLLEMADRDIHAFRLTLKAYKLPKETVDEADARHRAIQDALKACSEVPFELFNTCRAMLPLADRLEQIANPSVMSDVLVGRYLLVAGVLGAKANVDVNLAGIDDSVFCTGKRRHMEQMLRESRIPTGI